MQRQGLHFLLPYMRPYRNALIIGTLYALIGAGASAFSPTLLGWGIDDLTKGIDPLKLALYSVGIIVLAIVVALFRYLLRMLTGDIAAGVSYRMSQDLYHRLLLFDYETRQKYGTGDLLSRATNDFIYIWRFYSAGFQMAMHSLFLLLIGASLMAITSPAMAALVVVMLAISIFAQMRLGGIIEQAFARVQAETAKLSAFSQEHLNAVRMLTAYAQEKAVGEHFREANKAYVQQSMSFIIRSGLVSPLPSLMVRVAATIIVLVGGLFIIQGQLTVGQYVQFIVYLNLLNSGAQQITDAFERLQQGSAAAGRIGEVLHLLPKINDASDAQAPALHGEIRFDHVSVYAEDQERWILRDINLVIKPGSTVGIVGPTGAGKSMLISLLGRIYDPDEGAVLLDGYDLRQIKLATLRRNVVYVLQETLLFSMPLRGNIALGVAEASDPQIYRAMEKARLTNDLPQLPKGLDSIVGERGATLSGGQKQRTALARALVRNPKVLILDDALASVDMHTSAQIIEELRESAGGQERRTSIIVSQRMAAVRHADKIVVLNEGQIVEEGDHDTLLAQNGLYAEMYYREIQQAEEALA
ncbi:MAG: ABC transporter ATP-binding protein [Caldilineaceae bacterium]|nr:ABC transporter ATP-binding protein [Caldilineaceae bacterium]